MSKPIADLAELERRLKGWERWLRLRRSLAWAGWGLGGGLAVGLAASLTLLLAGRLLRPEFILLSLTVGLAGMVATALLGYLWRLPRQQAAIFLDRALGLKERLSTALELSRPGSAVSCPPELIQRQLSDALKASQGADPCRSLPLRFNRFQVLLATLLLAAVALVSVWGEANFQASLQRRILRQTIAEEIAKIEAIQAEIQANPNLTPEQRQELLQPLEKAIQGLQEAETSEQAVSVLSGASEELQVLENPLVETQVQALQEIGSSLAQQEDSPLQTFGEELSQGDYQAAAEQLSQIDPAALSPEDAADLAEALQESAQALQATNPALAEQLAQSAQALQNGDVQQAQEALQEAAQSLSQTGQEIAQSQAAGQVASQLAQGQQEIIQAGHGQADQAEQENQGTTQTPGQGAANQAGQAGSGAGAGKGHSNAGNIQGSEASNAPIAQNNGPGDGGEMPYEPIYAPTRLGGESDQTLALPTSGEPGERALSQGYTIPAAPGQSRVPYIEVYPYYAEFYRHAIESGQVPPSMRELVRRYFSSLEP